MRDDKSTVIYNLDSDTAELKGWLTDSTLKPLDELSPETEIIMKKLRKPIWLFFVALDKEKNGDKAVAESKVFLDWMKHLAYEY